MQSSTFQFKADDGKQIFVYRWLPEANQTPVGIIQISHGMAEHAGRYAPIAELLTQAGFIVYGSDHRGHGKTIEQEEDVGFFAATDGWNRVIRDVHQLSLFLKQSHPGLPLVLLAHSMGSFIAQNLMFSHGTEYAAVILSGSNGKVGPLRLIGVGISKLELMRVGVRGRSMLIHKMSFGDFNKPFQPSRTDFDWLSREPKVVDAYMADKRCGFVATVSLWNQFLIGLGELERPSNLAHIPKDLPVYIVAGQLDPVSNACKGLASLLEGYRIAGLKDVTHKFYAEARHEILNETNRAEVVQEMLTWLQPRLPARS